MQSTLGIHHVTAICGDAQRNVDFYAGVLGLRLVKRTVNFDDPQTYHLYYGDETVSPGSLITFFPWPDAARGRVGPGQVATTSFAVPPAALGFWIERLIKHGVEFIGPQRQPTGDVEEQVLSFDDRDGLMLKIVATPLAENRAGWGGAPGISEAMAIRGLHGVALWENNGQDTALLLSGLLGFSPIDEMESTRRFAYREAVERGIVDIRSIGAFPLGVIDVGTVHHVAWRVSGEDELTAMRERIVAAGLDPSPVVDRQYFRSVYFREPGGVLFELATDGPGFAVDEPVERLGETIVLPPRLQPFREELILPLAELHTPTSAAALYRDA